ncbi:ead/Ea22-like family protein [Escherichia coli]|nr:ead/Ea22-like family protein [Escherichia coli]
MSKINYQALREAAEAAKGDMTWQNLQAFRAAATPEVVLALLDEREAQNKCIAELEACRAALAAENTGLKSDAPLGAIENGRAFADRLENYQFESEGGNLNMCSDWQEFRRCFECLSEWVMHSQPVPILPAVLERLRSIVADPRALPRRKEWVSGQQYSYVLLENVEAMVDEACRTAMLQGKGGA